jgi:hypothetical protein
MRQRNRAGASIEGNHHNLSRKARKLSLPRVFLRAQDRFRGAPQGVQVSTECPLLCKYEGPTPPPRLRPRLEAAAESGRNEH